MNVNNAEGKCLGIVAYCSNVTCMYQAMYVEVAVQDLKTNGIEE